MVGGVAGVGPGPGLLPGLLPVRGEVAHVAPAVVTDAHTGGAAAPLYDGPLSVRTVNTPHELLEGCLVLELVYDGVQRLGSLLVVSLVVTHHGSLGSAGIDCRGSDQA